MKPGRELLFCALGGSGEIGMNVNLYGCDGKWLMVDLGMTFATPDYPGIDLVFADLDFIEKRRDDLVGIVITHAHEDHIGAIPYFAQELGVPLFATPFTARLIADKLAEAGLSNDVEVRIVDHLDRFTVGPFGLRYLPMAHSIAEANAVLIDTPYGRVFHSGDWKLDDDPRVGTPTAAAKLAAIGDEGVLALVCDSTNVFNPEVSGSEGEVLAGLRDEVGRHSGRRVLVTTFASNVARLQTLGEVAKATGRRLCVAGRSLDRIIGAARASGYLKRLPEPVAFDAAMRLPRGEVLIVATGGQGEPRAALSRIAEGTHQLALEAGDVVLFSSRQIPGNEAAIGRIQNRLAERCVEIVTDRQNVIHVSGHPGRPELEALYGWLRPKVVIPVHGEVRHLREQANLASGKGVPASIFQENGDLVRLGPGKPGKIGTVRVGRLVLDGEIIAPADGDAMVMRRRLATVGVVVVALGARGRVEVAGIGLPLEEDYDAFTAEAARDVTVALSRLTGAAARDREARSEAARLAARRAAQRWSGKKPQVQVMLLDD